MWGGRFSKNAVAKLKAAAGMLKAVLQPLLAAAEAAQLPKTCGFMAVNAFVTGDFRAGLVYDRVATRAREEHGKWKIVSPVPYIQFLRSVAR